ncbi:MAG: hypothetical protein WB786_08330 [Thermoplasmata archaeon]
MVGLIGLLVSGFAFVLPPAFGGISTSGPHPGGRLTLAGGPPNPCNFGNHATAKVNQSSGPGGVQYWINGSGYYPYFTTLSIYWGVTGQSGPYQFAGTAPVTFVSPSNGTFSVKLVLPPAGPGYVPATYNITAQDFNNDCGSTSFRTTSATLQVPQLTIGYPQTGIVGTATSVGGSYFTNSTTISPITIDSVAIACSGGSDVTSSTGKFTCDFTIPDSVPAGTYPVIATDPAFGAITSTNEFTDTGGQTTTVVGCSPNPIGTSNSYAPFYYLRASSNCTATVTDPGAEYAPTGTVTWSSSSTTGVFFTWVWLGTEYGYTPTTTCTLNTTSQCTISYADSVPGLPTITGDYSGDTYNLAGSGTDSLLVVLITTPTVVVSCNPSFVTTSSSCTADVTGSSPRGVVTWTPYNTYMPSKTGFFAPTTCTLVGGTCSVTYYSPPIYYTSCPSDSFQGCSSPIVMGAQYDGDALNAPTYGFYNVAIGLAGDQFDAFANGVVAELPFGWTCQFCKNTSGETGGMGTQTASFSEHVSGYAIGSDGPVDASDAFSVMGNAPTGEIAATGTSTNGGDAVGSVFIADTVTVTGQCDVSGNPDPGNLLDCLGISLNIAGDVQAYCDDSNGGCQGAAEALAGGSYEMCDLDQPTSYGYACASGSIGAEACAGSCGTCPPLLPDPSYVCNPLGSASLDFQSPPPVFFGPDTTISSGDSLYLSEMIGATVEDTALGSAALTIDPSFRIVNLDPSAISVSVGAAEVIALANPSALQLSSTITPNPVAAGHEVEDNTTITNVGTSAIYSINATGSLDGPLSCPGYDIYPGGNMTCTGTFTPEIPGAQIDTIVVNGTNLTDPNVNNGTTAPFFVTPTPYNVTFNETGLTPGASWTVLLNGTPENSSASTITFSVPYGVYWYEVIPPVGSTAAPSNGPLSVYDSARGENVTITLGPGGLVIGAIAELYAVYDQRPDLQTLFPDANGSFANFTELVSWAGSVVDGQISDLNYTTLAPYGFWYTLMATYNDRADLRAAFPNAYGVWTTFGQLVDWAGNAVNDSFADSSASTLAPFGPWYALMLTYNNRSDLQTAFPDALTNLTNWTLLVNWAGGVVMGEWNDSANSTLQKFGYYYDLMTIYDNRSDLQAAFPDAFTNWDSEGGLLWWAGAVVNGTISDSANATLQPFGYFYALVGLVYENRADLNAAFPLAATDGGSYQGLLTWAADMVLGDFTDSSYSTLLPYAAEYEARG